MTGAPAELGRRSLIKAGLAASILALWQAETSWALEYWMSTDKKRGRTPGILTMADVYAVWPALAHYTEGPLLTACGNARSFRRVVTMATLSRTGQLTHWELLAPDEQDR